MTVLRYWMLQVACLVAGFLIQAAYTQDILQFTSVQKTNQEVALKLQGIATGSQRIDWSTNLGHWDGLVTLGAGASTGHTDSAAPYFPYRYYRALNLGSNAFTGDHLATSQGDAVIHGVYHASFVISWNGLTIYSDPAPPANFTGLPKADLILVTHSHGDHFNASAIASVKATNALLVTPRDVYNSLNATLKAATTVLTNNSGTNLLGIQIDAVPAYNSNHPKGTGNGYVLTLGDKRIYISGDTGDIPETRALQNIDVAFLCMNVPFTMTVNSAASVTREFRPRAVYPYHYRNQDNTFSDLNSFKRQVGTDGGVEVRLRKWY